jgi:hypothetical protein
VRLSLVVAVFAVSTALAPSIAAAQATQPVSPTQAARFTLDTPIEALVADPRSRAVLEANLPGIAAHPMYESFKGMSLRQLQPMSQGHITAEVLARVETGLATIR